jgi:uncharacterized ferredoxin-like protein
MIINERDNRNDRLLQVAYKMMTAARTAPKGKGLDIIEIGLISGDNIKLLSDDMLKQGTKSGFKSMLRDGENILQSEVIVLIGTKSHPLLIDCGYCGFESCAHKNEHESVPCAINTVDVGIAIGSACAVAADHRVDSRVMISAGRIAQKLNFLPNATSIYAIPISCSSKNPFFDRQPKQ